jgi:O-antigen/teichoic acid export membrane protein
MITNQAGGKAEKPVTQLVIVSIFIAICAYAIRLLFNVVLSRHLGKVLYGDFSLGRMLMVLVGTLTLLGTATSSKKFFAKYLVSEVDRDASSRFVTWNLRLMVVSFCFLFALLAGLAIVLVVLHLFDVKRLETYHLAFYMLWLAPIFALIVLLGSYLRCNKNIYWSNFLMGAGFYFFGLIVFVPAIYFLEMSLDVGHLFLFVLGILLLLLLLEVFLSSHYLSSVLFSAVKNLIKPSALTTDEDKKSWRTLSLTLVLNQIIFSTLCVLDIILVELFSGKEGHVGEYAACTTIWGLQFLLTTQVFSTFSFRISSLMSNVKDKKILQGLISSAQMINLVMTVALFVVICVFAKPILLLFGPHFDAASIALMILAAAGLVNGVIGPCASLMAYAGSEKTIILLSLIQFCLMIGLGVPLTIYFGIIGTASAALCSIAFKSVCMQIIVKKRLGFKMWFVI